ncbi:MAG: hypothetical protein ACKOXO_12210 [Cyanobium sp.]
MVNCGWLRYLRDPTGAACRFAIALRLCLQPAQLPVGLGGSPPASVPLTAVEEAADAEDRYRVQFQSGAAAPFAVICWRRLPGSSAWCCRCGPMALAVFIARFLPGDPL